MSGLDGSLRGVGSSDARSEEWSAHFLEESALVDVRNLRGAQAPVSGRMWGDGEGAPGRQVRMTGIKEEQETV